VGQAGLGIGVRMGRIARAVAAYGLLGLLLAGCGVAPVGAQQRNASAGTSAWILQYQFLPLITSDPEALRVFARATIYVVLVQAKDREDGIPPSALHLVPTAYFNSYATFVGDVDAHQLSPQIRAVIFDDSADTPASVVPPVEAAHPYQYDQMFAAFAAAHGLLSMCDYILPSRLGHGAKVGEAPPCAVELLNSSQQSERSAAQYEHVVRQAVQVAHAVNAAMPVFAGLSTNPRGSAITASELAAAVGATDQMTAGYWISIPPAGGIGCRACASQDPALLPAFLALLDGRK